MITYLPSDGVYEKDGGKQIRPDGQDEATQTHARDFSAQFSSIAALSNTDICSLCYEIKSLWGYICGLFYHSPNKHTVHY